ncbi:MAG: hypothetical protein FWG80_01580 [Alphaproteobacteria bacterium]|nr:hypothetical protein [Alphaproteobacteria bacterium]
MKKLFAAFVVCAMCLAFYVPSGADGSSRGNAGLANAYRQNQRNTYYVVNTPDVDSACRARIFQCLSDYCGDVTVIPGQRGSRCTSASEGELYNYALLCLQRDHSELMPAYSTSFATGGKGMNSAARLCPSYVQQELMSYLSMANMAEQLTKQRSDTCVHRRRELEAAMSCHQIALSNGNETANRLNSTLTDFCGAGVPGGSSEMVTRYSNAGNVGANIWGWAEKIVSLDLSKKGAEWQSAVDSVLAGYVNRMNLACGENMQLQTVAREKDTGPTNLQIAAVMAVGAAFPVDESYKDIEDPYQANRSLWHEVRSMTNIYDYASARQVINAGLSSAPTIQNAFLTSATMGAMQSAYAIGVKVFLLRDAARCYIVPVQPLDAYENSVLAQQLSECRFN